MTSQTTSTKPQPKPKPPKPEPTREQVIVSLFIRK
jgi:hypothetical protein